MCPLNIFYTVGMKDHSYCRNSRERGWVLGTAEDGNEGQDNPASQTPYGAVLQYEGPLVFSSSSSSDGFAEDGDENGVISKGKRAKHATRESTLCLAKKRKGGRQGGRSDGRQPSTKNAKRPCSGTFLAAENDSGSAEDDEHDLDVSNSSSSCIEDEINLCKMVEGVEDKVVAKGGRSSLLRRTEEAFPTCYVCVSCLSSREVFSAFLSLHVRVMSDFADEKAVMLQTHVNDALVNWRANEGAWLYDLEKEAAERPRHSERQLAPDKTDSDVSPFSLPSPDRPCRKGGGRHIVSFL